VRPDPTSVVLDGMSNDLSPDGITVSWRADSGYERSDSWLSAGVDVLGSAAPWRTFRWHNGQRHYSGAFWSSTMSDHVIYESWLAWEHLSDWRHSSGTIGACFAGR
jgi:hypothetical protein